MHVPGLPSGWGAGKRTPTTAPPASSSWHHQNCHREEEDSWDDRMAGPQTPTPAQPERYAEENGCKIWKPSLLLFRVRAAAARPLSSLGRSDRSEGVRDKTRCGLPWLSTTPSFPQHNLSSHPAGEGSPRRWSPRRAPPPPAFVAIRIPMLLFLTGHWWLYRQVLRRGCNCPGRARWLPNPLPNLAARVLPAPTPCSSSTAAVGGARPPDASESTGEFPP